MLGNKIFMQYCSTWSRKYNSKASYNWRIVELSDCIIFLLSISSYTESSMHVFNYDFCIHYDNRFRVVVIYVCHQV